MNFTLRSSPPEITASSLESLRSKNTNLLASKASIKVGDFANKENIQAFNRDARKVVISSQLVPHRLEGSHMRKKRLEEPNRKLEFTRTLLIDNYDSYTYNIFQELSIINGCKSSLCVSSAVCIMCIGVCVLANILTILSIYFVSSVCS